MENTDKKRTNWVNVFVSPRISTSQGVGVNLFQEEIEELVNKAEEVNPDGRIVVSIFHKVERFRPLSNAMANLVFAERYYPNAIAFGNAEVAKEWSDVLEHLNAINKIVEKRRKIYNQRKKGIANKSQKNGSEANTEAENLSNQ